MDHAQHVRAIRGGVADRQPARPHRVRRRAAGTGGAIDLFPTLAELCGHAAPKGIHGRSFATLLKNRRYAEREFAYSEYYSCHRVFTRDDRYVGKSPILMVRTGGWKLNYQSWSRSELFDLRKDPGEFRNCIDDCGNAGIAKELTAIAQRMFAV